MGAPATTGNKTIDSLFGLGYAVTAHFRMLPAPEDGTSEPTMMTWAYQQDLGSGDLMLRLLEFDSCGRTICDEKPIRLLGCSFPPHDFLCTRGHALWLSSPSEGNLLPFILGAKGPAQCIGFSSRKGSTFHVLTRG